MPSYTGVSVLGLQKCGFSVRPDDGTMTLDFSGANRPDRLTRCGTILICQEIFVPTRFRTLAVYKLYGNGLVTPALSVVSKFNLQTHIWINWFVPSLQWSVGTF